jgi:hypothetical protein
VLRANDSPALPEFVPWISHPASGYAYQDYNFGVPFSAWDVDASPPVRLSVGHLESNAITGRVDGRYWPPAESENLDNGWICREWFFVFSLPYSDTALAELKVDTPSLRLPITWLGSPTRQRPQGFVGDEEFLIVARHPLTAEDRWTFNPVTFLEETGEANPIVFTLAQNFPNPFNPTTEIRFDIPGVPARGAVVDVRLVVYDILGREVATLMNERKAPGSYAVKFNGKGFSSGVYFYRLSAGSRSETKKLLLLR